ncbi:MAG: hypothetical protein AAF458_24695 [Pseudomonadota bacterium]
MTRDKVREQLGPHLHALSAGDISLLYSLLLGLEPAGGDTAARNTHEAICEVLLQLLIASPASNLPLEKLRAVEVPNPRMKTMLAWYARTVAGTHLPAEVIDSWARLIPAEKRAQWRRDADEADAAG